MEKENKHFDFVSELIRLERIRQDEKWGEQNRDNCEWALILMEEVGELCKDIYEGKTYNQLTYELVQCAAVCVVWLEQFQRNNRVGE